VGEPASPTASSPTDSLMTAKSIVPNLKIISIVIFLFLALSHDGRVLAFGLKDSPSISISTSIVPLSGNIFLEPKTVIIHRKGEKQKEEPDLTNASWWDKLLYKFRILQMETEFVDDEMEKTISGEKSLLILTFFLAIVLFWQNNVRLKKKSPRSRSRRFK
jgi:hypothetical protein